MNVQVIKTKAEQALATLLAERIPSLPGARGTREAAAQRFEALGLPHRRIEEWKYSDVRSLAKDTVAAGQLPRGAALERAAEAGLGATDVATFVFVDGKLASKPDADVEGVTVESFAAAVTAKPELLSPALPSTVDVGLESVIALNTALASDGAVVRIANGSKPEKVIHLVFVSTGYAAYRTVIVAGADSEATVVETHVSAGDTARQEYALKEARLEAGASLHHIVEAETEPGTLALAATIVQLAKGATYRPFHMTTGDGISRHQVLVDFAGEHASLDFGAAALAGASGHSDTTLVIDHAVPRCISRELFKTVLDGRARGIFQGKVIVRPDAQKTDGKQMAQALMLSPDAEFDSKPELEIYADDVVCGHGTTSAELDEDLLFYLRSRGIPLVEARALLVESFIGEAIDRIAQDELREAFMARARAWLAKGHI